MSTKLHPQSETVCSSKSGFAEEKKALKSEYAWEKRVKLQNAYIACIKPWMQSATKKGRWGGEGRGGREERRKGGGTERRWLGVRVLFFRGSEFNS